MASFKATPGEIDIAITGRCNLKCAYCFYADEMVALQDLPTAVWLSFFEELKQLGVMRVSLTGGEVFTRADLFEIIDGLIDNNMRYDILTNGTLITEETLEQFAVGKRRLRLDNIQISIDGSSAEIHNQSRPNSFERALRGLRLLKEAHIPVNARVTLGQNNLHDLKNLAQLLLEDIGLRQFSTNQASPIGNGCHSQHNLGLRQVDVAEAMAVFKELETCYPGRITSQAGPQAKIKMYETMERARATGTKDAPWKMGYLSGCGCPFSRISVLHDGSIVPCHMLHGVRLGNIQHDSLLEIWQTHPDLTALRQRRNIPLDTFAGCRDCEWAPYCSGSCPGPIYEQTGNYNLPNRIDCYRQFLAETGR